jgi:predicted metal-dependent TIM-barrel fold hydrolase
VGGINPQAVRYFAEVEGHLAKVVWMPTHDSEKEVTYLKQNRPYVIVSEHGALLPSVLSVLDLIAQYKLTLATGHVSPQEMVQIVTEARKRGVDRIVITHPGLGPQFTDPTIEQLKRVTGMGAYAEVVASQLLGKSRDETIKVIKAIGPARCIVSSDSGLVGSPGHADALVLSARLLRAAGFGEEELNLMFKTNPAKVLGLPVL